MIIDKDKIKILLEWCISMKHICGFTYKIFYEYFIDNEVSNVYPYKTKQLEYEKIQSTLSSWGSLVKFSYNLIFSAPIITMNDIIKLI